MSWMNGWWFDYAYVAAWFAVSIILSFVLLKKPKGAYPYHEYWRQKNCDD